MRKFIIERKIAGLGDMSPEQLHEVTCASNEVLRGMEQPYHWIQSYVTDDTLYCVHVAPDAETILDHARRGGFPADRVVEVRGIIDPTS